MRLEQYHRKRHFEKTSEPKVSNGAESASRRLRALHGSQPGFQNPLAHPVPSVVSRSPAPNEVHGVTIDPSKTNDTLPEPDSPGTIVSLS
jgi:hypothetical protein